MKDVVVSEVGRNKMANFKCWACISQVRDIEEEFPHIKLDCQSVKDMEKVCYLDDIIRARSYTVVVVLAAVVLVGVVKWSGVGCNVV